MGNHSPTSKRRAFTLIELLVVVCIAAILAVMIIPALNRPDHDPHASCMFNQRQIGLTLAIFNSDHAGLYPWQLSATNGGSMESISTARVFPHFRPLPDITGYHGKVFVCPADKEKHPLASVSQLSDDNISYFINVDVTTNSSANTVLTGDRNLQANGRAVKSGLLELSTNLDLNWSPPALHRGGGILGFVDGHVQFVKTNQLNASFFDSARASNRLCLP